MPDKRRERYHLDALRRAIPELPDGPPDEPEPPDFVLHLPGRRLGIEFTIFHYPPGPGERPHQERQSLKDRIVALANELHHRAGGPALYVSVYFSSHQRLSKRDTQPLAAALAAALLAHPVPRVFQDPDVRLDFHELPAGVASITAHGSIDGVDRLWQADAGGWVAPIGTSLIQGVVDAKAGTARLARMHCDELWLVVVNDEFSGAAPAEISAAALEATYQGPFERLVWLLPHVPRALPLRLVRPAA